MKSDVKRPIQRIAWSFQVSSHNCYYCDDRQEANAWLEAFDPGVSRKEAAIHIGRFGTERAALWWRQVG